MRRSTCTLWIESALAVALLCVWTGPASVHGDEPKLEPPLARMVERVRAEQVIDHARTLSDPAFRGRRAASEGAGKAADYIMTTMRKVGLRPGGGAGRYDQVFKISTGYRITSTLEIAVAGTSIGELRRGVDYMPVYLPEGKTTLVAGCVLVGYGLSVPKLNFDEYTHVDVKDKVAIAFSGTPWSAETGRWLPREKDMPDYATPAYKAMVAHRHGARALVVVDNPAGWRDKLDVEEHLRMPDLSPRRTYPIPVIHVTRRVLAETASMRPDQVRLLALEIASQRKGQSMLLRGRSLSLKAAIDGIPRIGRNVIGILPGRDDRLRREAVVLGAHYDHLGQGAGEDIFFGANDNAAGVGALLAIARAMASSPTAPRRTIVFVAFDAEEIGRIGSRTYVRRPPIPIDRTVLMINFDMIGRNEPDEINVVASRTSELVHTLHQQAARQVGLKLQHPLSYRLGRSDHTAFYDARVPVMYLFGGIDPDYNTPRDTWEKLIPGKVEKVARLALLSAWTVAERDDRPVFVPAPDPLAPPPARQP